MSRRIAVLAVAAVLLVTVGTPLALAAPTGTTAALAVGDGPVASSADNGTATQTPSADDSDETPPGLKLAGVVSVQASETRGELQRRTFETRFQRANSNASKAAVVAGEVTDARDRLQRLREEKAQLQARHENGSISDGQYRVRMTSVVAELERTKAMLNRTSDAARTVPDQALREHGVDRAEVDRLRNNASELSGPEVSEIARGLAGPNPGKGLDKRAADDGNETTTASDATGAPPGTGSDEGNGNAGDRGNGAGHGGTGDNGNAPDSPPGQATDGGDGVVTTLVDTVSSAVTTVVSPDDGTTTAESTTTATENTTAETATATATAEATATATQTATATETETATLTADAPSETTVDGDAVA